MKLILFAAVKMNSQLEWVFIFLYLDIFIKRFLKAGDDLEFFPPGKIGGV